MVSDFWSLREIIYVRRSPPLGDLIGGFAERWDLRNDAGAVVATLSEPITAIERVGRLLSSRFAYQQRHRLTIRDSSGSHLFDIVKEASRLGRETADVWTAGRRKAGSVELTGLTGTDRLGLALLDPQGNCLGVVRHAGDRVFDVVDGAGAALGRLTSKPDRSTLSLSGHLAPATMTLIVTVPIVQAFIRG